MGKLQLVDQYLCSLSSRCIPRLLADTETVYESLWILLTESFQQVKQKLLNHVVLDVYSGDELRYDVDPYFEIDLVNAVANYLVYLWVVAMLEPDLHETQSVLQSFGGVARCDLVAQLKLLDKTLNGVYDMCNILQA